MGPDYPASAAIRQQRSENEPGRRCRADSQTAAITRPHRSRQRHQSPPDGAGLRRTRVRPGKFFALDPGWDYNTGADALGGLQEVIDQRLSTLDAPLGAAMWPGLKTALSEQSATRFGRWVDDVLAAGRGRGLHAIVGAMTQREVSHYTGAAGVAPATAEIAVEDRLLVGRKADRHAREASALTPDERKRLPLALANERRSYFDRLEKKMIYVLPSLDADRPVKIAVQVDVSAGHPKRALNIARAGHKINVQALAARTRYEPIEEA